MIYQHIKSINYRIRAYIIIKYLKQFYVLFIVIIGIYSSLLYHLPISPNEEGYYPKPLFQKVKVLLLHHCLHFLFCFSSLLSYMSYTIC